jgi:non-specific serine/threonine protein kinase/serine/threonine-protein kinase
MGMIGGRYRLNGVLGEGGMARVFDAFDDRLERPVAVKILRPQTESLPGMRRRFQQEARISARLVHPNIVAVLDFGEDGAASYLVMERLPGRTLRDEISHGPIARERLVPLMVETLGALAAAHKCGVLHRDIKPSNILLDDDGHAKITDFGIAKSFDAQADSDPTADLTMTGVVLGTPGYLAPERRAGHSATVQSDLYSVGAVMVEALLGRRLRPEVEDEANLPPELGPIATRALARDPSQRFTSADEMMQALRLVDRPRTHHATSVDPTEPWAGATAVLPAAPAATSVLRSRPAPPPRAARPRWSRFLLPAIAAAIVCALLLLFLLEGGQPAKPHASGTSRTTVVRHHATAKSDPEGTAITQLATSLASGGLPGDGSLASALEATAAQSPGAGRQAAAEATLTLAGVLLAGGGISGVQFQDVATVLQPTGATVPTTTIPAPLGPDHGHGQGGDKGGN